MHRVGRTFSRCPEEEQSSRREEPSSGRSSGRQAGEDDVKDEETGSKGESHKHAEDKGALST